MSQPREQLRLFVRPRQGAQEHERRHLSVDLAHRRTDRIDNDQPRARLPADVVAQNVSLVGVRLDRQHVRHEVSPGRLRAPTPGAFKREAPVPKHQSCRQSLLK